MDFLWLLIESTLYGVLIAYLAALVPSLVITALHREWMYLAVGFLTLGILWIVGALKVISPSRRFALVGIGAIFVVGFFAARPAVVLDLNGRALQADVGGILAFEQECEGAGDRWICFRYDDTISGDRSYRTKTDRLGCWTGTTELSRYERRAEFAAPRKIEGCVSVIDYISAATRESVFPG